MRARWFVIFAILQFPLCAADITVHGRVVDENDAPVRDAHVRAQPDKDAQTDPTGAFTITLTAPGDLVISIEREGYYALKEHTVHVDSSREFTFVLNSVREVFQSENVNAQTSPVDVGETQNEEHLSGTEVNDIPYANSHSLRNALELLPGAVQDVNGTLHINGAAENQVLYLFNGFNINNPITGEFQTLLPVEGIRSVDLSSGQSSTEYGKGSAGVLRINTETGTDKFHYTATDFVPGIDIKQGVRLGNWYPRAGISGPIRKGRAWFADTFESEITQTLVSGLPRGQNTSSGWAGSNVLHVQTNLSSSNLLFADFLVNVYNLGRVGLGPLNPVETTYSKDTRQYLGSVKDQQYFGHGALIEVGYAHNYFSSKVIPQGDGLYILSPDGNSGNYFIHSTQAATRDQGLLQAFLPKFQLAGSHQIEAGTDIDWLHYSADFHRTGYEVLGLSGELLSETVFPTPAEFQVSDSEMSVYLLDTWRVLPRFQVTLGVRGDRDEKIRATGWSPRLAFSWSPWASARTKISAGYSVTHDAVTMQMLGLPLDQVPVTTTSDGQPATSTFQIPRNGLSLPRANNWTAAVAQQLPKRLFAEAKYLRRRGTDAFAFVNELSPNAPPSLLPSPNPQTAALYQLTNLGREDYDSVAFSVRQTLSGQYGWLASYTWSRSLSNAVIDPNSPVALQSLDDLVVTPWDVPNRILARGYAPLPWKNWAISALGDMRTGFPFSVRDDTGVIVGAVDSHRFPVNFDLNIAIERMLTLRGRRFALRGGVDNLTNQANPTAVNSVLGAPQYLHFLGNEGRHFVVRIRFFGKSR